MLASAAPDQIKESLLNFQQEMKDELVAILSYWEQYTIDKEKGGFFGSVNNQNIPDQQSPKGVVLNSRICWAFSSAYLLNGDLSYLKIAKRAFDYITNHFIDNQFGGVFWSVNASGEMLDGRKQIYGLAFCIYGSSEYYKASKDEKALQRSKDLFYMIERYSRDETTGGYIEAFSREWLPIDDLRLSDKDNNEQKTVNTHLHILEAYMNLYQVWPANELHERIIGLLNLFARYFINADTKHLNLFFNGKWELKSELYSYGHDIEASWLLQEAAMIANDADLIQLFQTHAISLAIAAAEGLDTDGGLWYEYEPEQQHLIKEKHSWPQAEAMIGFFNAWRLTDNHDWLDASLQSWEFVKRYIRDELNGEWFWGVDAEYAKMEKDKAGFWKCPYHNTRAAMELIRRLEESFKPSIR